MSSSASSLIIAVVGVLGTLFSGLLAHRSSVHAKQIELDHATRRIREEREDARSSANLEARRTSYAEINRTLRNYHSALRATLMALQDGRAVGSDTGGTRGALDEAREELRATFAVSQMIASDEVLNPVGELVQLLHFLYNNIVPHAEGSTPGFSLEDLRTRLDKASQGLYEVRQIMRRDLGLTSSPVERPDGYGVFG